MKYSDALAIYRPSLNSKGFIGWFIMCAFIIWCQASICIQWLCVRLTPNQAFENKRGFQVILIALVVMLTAQTVLLLGF